MLALVNSSPIDTVLYGCQAGTNDDPEANPEESKPALSGSKVPMLLKDNGKCREQGIECSIGERNVDS